MKSQTRFSLFAMLLALSAVAVMSRCGRSSLELTISPPNSRGGIEVSLHNRGSRPVAFYDSLSGTTSERAPGLMSIRFEDADGRPVLCRGTDEHGFWVPDYTQTKRVPVVLASLPAGGAVRVETALPILTQGFDSTPLSQAVRGQIRCAVFLEQGVIESRTGWFALPPAPRRAP